MSTCKKCGGFISFYKKQGKWWPKHDFDECRRIYRLKNPPEEKTVKVTLGKHKEFYTGEVPPWDESLGDFICFEGCCGQMRTILTNEDLRA